MIAIAKKIIKLKTQKENFAIEPKKKNKTENFGPQGTDCVTISVCNKCN